MMNELTKTYFVIQHSKKYFTSTIPYKRFSEYFYTEQEYNRIKNLKELLNEN